MFGRRYAFLFAIVFVIASGFTSINEDFGPPAQTTLLHYWNFNSTSFLVPNKGNGSITYSLSSTGDVVTDTGQSFAGANAREGDGTGLHLRVNNPIGTKIDYHLSTVGYQDIVIKYETRRSGSGAGTQRISYTTNGTDYIFFTEISPVDGTPQIAALDFSAVANVSDNENFGIRFEFQQGSGGLVGNNRFDNFTVEGTNAPADVLLLHYWNFNNTDFLLPNTGNGSISYSPGTAEVITGTGQDFAGANAQNGSGAGAHLRVNNPVGVDLRFNFSTEGYKSIVVKYETRRSGSGAGIQKISYTLDGIDYTDFTTINPADAAPAVITLDFTAVEGASDNANFGIRFLFETGAGGNVGNNRFDNLTVEGISKDTVIPGITYPVVLLTPADGSTDVSLKPSLSWNALTDALSYTLQVSSTNDFESTVINLSISNTTYKSIVQLNTSSAYYWRVRGSNLGGDGPWSDIWSFTTSESAVGSALRVNEVMASNGGFIGDDDGDFSDWIEIYNTGSSDVDLSGFGLTDDPTSPFKWSFPAVTIAPHEFLLVWASNKNRITPGSPLHTNFAISASGESVTITNADGILIDTYITPAMADNISYGRFPDGTGDWIQTNTPTPGLPNADGGLPLDASVSFSHTAGFYESPFDLNLTTSESGATILYTTDGSEPDISKLSGFTYQYKIQYAYEAGDIAGDLLENTYQTQVFATAIHMEDRSADVNRISNIVTTPLKSLLFDPPPVEKATVVKARVYKTGYQPGPVTTHTFFFGPRSNHDLPVFSFAADEDQMYDYTNGLFVPGKAFEDGRLQNPDLTTGNYYALDGKKVKSTIEFFETTSTMPIFSQGVTMEVQGGYTRNMPEKSLRLNANTSFAYKFFDSRPTTTFRNIVLRNFGNDWPGSLIRDAAIQTSISHLTVGTQAYRPGILYVNGEYHGLTSIRERIDKYYVANNYGADINNIDLIEVQEVKEGDGDLYNYLQNYLVESDMSDDTVFAEAEKLMDMDNFIDYQVSEIYNANYDWPGNNFMLWRSRNVYDPNGGYKDGRFRWIIKDTDAGWRETEQNTLAYATYTDGLVWQNPKWATDMLNGPLKNEGFKKRFISRFADLMNTAFLPSRLVNHIDQLSAEIQNEVPKHAVRWNFPQDWQAELNVLKDFVNQRAEFQRQHIAEKFSLPGVRNLTVNVDPAKGYIHINTIDILPSTPGVSATPYPWTGVYFEGVPVTIKAVATAGYTFIGWQGADLPANAEVTVNLTADMNITAIFGMAIDLLAPADNLDNVSTSPTFSWTESAPGLTYVIQVAKDDTFQNIALERTGVPTSYSADIELTGNTTYYWRVRIALPGHELLWTPARQFKTELRLPEAPVAVLPASKDLRVSVNPKFVWRKSKYAITYTIQLSTSEGLETVLDKTLSDTTYVFPQSLANSKNYYWRVKATNASGDSPWTSVRSFQTIESPPVVTTLLDATNPKATVTWSQTLEATGYDIQVSSSPEFEDVLVEEQLTDFLRIFSDLPDGIYYVRVRAVYDSQTGDWSEGTSFVIKRILGVGEEGPANITAYPNPVVDKFYLAIPKHFAVRSVVMIDEVGRSSQLQVSETESVIDISDRPAGIFFIRVTGTSGEATTLKIMKIK